MPAEANTSARLSYIPGLDGIRALAVLAVLCYHAGFGWALGGFLGVETFFVLSGFLITALLLNEWNGSGRIDLRGFWVRRARRLLPAVWLLLSALPLLAFLLARDSLPRLQEDIPAALLYVTNWVYILREVPYFEAFGRPPLLQQLWSLAVEEQFYVFWPLALLLLLRITGKSRALLAGTVLLMAAGSTLWMAFLYSPSEDPLRIYYGTDTRAAGFLIGAALAIIRPPGGRGFAHRPWVDHSLGWAGLSVLLFLFTYLNEFQPALYHGGFLAAAIASVLLIVGASAPGTLLGKLFEHPIPRWIGTRSYSIYLWHWPVLLLTRPGIDVDLPALPMRFAQLAMTFVLAELSYRWVETPIRQRGFRGGLDSILGMFRRRSLAPRLGVGAGLLSVGILIAGHASAQPGPLGVVDLAPSLQRGAIAREISPAVAQPAENPARIAASPTFNDIANTTPSPSTDSPPAVDPGPQVTFIGDSIMQGASPLMEKVLGTDIHIDAARKRRMEDVPEVVADLSDAGKLGRIIVIHLGSNRPFDPEVFDRVVETLLAHGVERMIFVNVHRPIGWETYANRQFDEGVARWPQTELVDWDAIAHTRAEWFIEDQTHLSYEGSEAYINAIVEKLGAVP